jgi:hypothetical protein
VEKQYLLHNTLRMKLPFTSEQFFEIFRQYNLSVFPAQIIIMLLAIISVVVASGKFGNSGKVVLPILGALWLWMGIVYHLIFFSRINTAAYVFGGLFMVQGMLFFVRRFTHVQVFAFHFDIRGIIAALFILYALVIYPVIGFLSNHAYPSQPTFGLPCPTTIFTFGMLLMAVPRLPWHFVIIPVLWSVIGFSAAFQFGVYEDIPLIVSAVVFCALAFIPLPAKSKNSLRVDSTS